MNNNADAERIFRDHCVTRMIKDDEAWGPICASRYPELVITYIAEKKLGIWVQQYNQCNTAPVHIGDTVDMASALHHQHQRPRSR